MSHINQLAEKDLVSLRKQIILNSLFLSDYDNSYGIDLQECNAFFDGYLEYLFEIAYEDCFEDIDDVSSVINKYDTRQNLLAWGGICA